MAPSREVIEIEDSSEYDDEDAFSPELLNLDDFDNGELGYGVDPAYYGFGDNGDAPIRQNFVPDLPTQQAPSFEECLGRVVEVYPDICHDHIRQLYDTQVLAFVPQAGLSPQDQISQLLILQILDTDKYPKESDRRKELKRKRSVTLDSDEEDAATWTAVERAAYPDEYSKQACKALSEEFSRIPRTFIDSKFRESRRLYTTYLALEQAERTYDQARNPPYQRLKCKRMGVLGPVTRLTQPSDDADALAYGVEELRREIHAARKKRRKDDDKRQLQKAKEDAEAAEDAEYERSGDVMECQCCFSSTPFHKATHCSGDEPHFFCLECAKNYAASELGKQKWKLSCMDGSGCEAEFDRAQKLRFLDEKTFQTFERLEQQAAIKQAEMEGLASCPFCDFAAICPPVKVDREFRCRNPECEKVSCRLCEAESHIPLTCEEFKKENGVSERHAVEEAMTAALIRECPKCKKKFVKDYGCNKMSCDTPGCKTLICYACGKDVTAVGYKHFSEPSAVSRGKCLLHDDTEKRHKEDVERAEKKAREKVRAENPHLTDTDLEIKMSDAAKSPAAANRMHGVNLYAQQHGRPPMAYGLPQAEAEAHVMHAAMVNNLQQVQQMHQLRNFHRAAAVMNWPRLGVHNPPGLDMNQYHQLQQPDPFVAGPFPQAQQAPFDPAARHLPMNVPPPVAMGAAPFPAYGDQQQQNRLNQRDRFGAANRRHDLDRAG
ncbi:hypothetical protein LPUS_10983 [Lasallia pustulata]|uniref:RING-type domain-containing protein n=1 Tax=Lasallia pustulata TaxID=136370 RepID=A0A1W5DAQ7_9LECA|nr:hypothetical protein LPUS_10983 [Lasallia pustulata]